MAVTIIAEVGLTHDGSLGNALRMVEVFAEAGADAVKFQHHGFQWGKLARSRTDETHPSPHVLERRWEYYKRTEFISFQWRQIRRACQKAGVEFIVSPFDPMGVEELEDSAPPDRYKVASGEVTNLPLLRAIRDTGRPVLLSMGMATDGEGTEALRALKGSDVLTMDCVSKYPCEPSDYKARRWADLTGFSNVWGLSDHSPPDSIAACLAAVTLGATVLERHVTLSRHMYGSDAWMSMEPSDFARLVREVRALERMLASTKSKDELVATPEIQAARKVFLNVAE